VKVDKQTGRLGVQLDGTPEPISLKPQSLALGGGHSTQPATVKRLVEFYEERVVFGETQKAEERRGGGELQQSQRSRRPTGMAAGLDAPSEGAAQGARGEGEEDELMRAPTTEETRAAAAQRLLQGVADSWKPQSVPRFRLTPRAGEAGNWINVDGQAAPEATRRTGDHMIDAVFRRLDDLDRRKPTNREMEAFFGSAAGPGILPSGAA
jgi:hypothetical protein